MAYIQEANDLATRYPYTYGVCEYVYLAHGDKAEEILKMGAENKLNGVYIMKLSDLCCREWMLFPPNNEGATDPIRCKLRLLNIKSKEDKLPRKLRAGWE